MNLNKLARRINTEIFDNQIDLTSLVIKSKYKLVRGNGIAGITYAFIHESGRRLAVVYIFTKYCKNKKFIKKVLIHEMVHVYQNQLKQKMNHNGAFMKYFCKKARKFGYEIEMGRV